MAVACVDSSSATGGSSCGLADSSPESAGVSSGLDDSPLADGVCIVECVYIDFKRVRTYKLDVAHRFAFDQIFRQSRLF